MFSTPSMFAEKTKLSHMDLICKIAYKFWSYELGIKTAMASQPKIFQTIVDDNLLLQIEKNSAKAKKRIQAENPAFDQTPKTIKRKKAKRLKAFAA